MAASKAKSEAPLRARALRMLARREYSRSELERRLAPFTEDPAEISELLADFERRGWLSEQRVVEQVTASRGRRFGVQRIVRELREKGIGENAIAAVLPALEDTELEAARAVWRKKFGKLPHSMAERARQVRFMQSRGFSLETVLRIIRQGGNDDCLDHPA